MRALMRFVLLSFTLLSFSLCLFAQEVDVLPYIKAWKLSDRTQTHKAVVFFDSLDAKKDTAYYKRTVEALQRYQKKRPNKRVEARLLMYEAFGSMVFKWVDDKYRLMLEKAMKIAHELKDDQLLAEVYVLYAEIASLGNHPLYNLKAIELQRRIGFNHFHTVHNRFFIVSTTLYHSQDYRQSIQYGLECLSFINTDREHWLKRIYVLQLDILGACYKKLHKYDSAIYYYQKILDTLQANPDTGATRNLWTGIAKGNIGHCLVLQKQYEKGIPMIKEYVQSSLEAHYPFNVAMASCFLADAYNAQGLYQPALSAWQQAYFYADTSQPEQYLLEATQGIAHIYKNAGEVDSAYYYYDRYHRFADVFDEYLDATRLSAINARMNFDTLQEHLRLSKEALGRSKVILQLTIAASILLLAIVLLFYSRYRLKNRHKLELIQKSREQAQAAIDNAKKQVEIFRDHIIEKNSLIESLQTQLQDSQEWEHNQLNQEKLSHYMLISEEGWETFRSDFSKAYPHFFPKLRQLLPGSTPAEERLSALIFLRLNNFQITKMLGIERDSVARARRRLKNRFQLAENDSLDEFLGNILADNP